MSVCSTEQRQAFTILKKINRIYRKDSQSSCVKSKVWFFVVISTWQEKCVNVFIVRLDYRVFSYQRGIESAHHFCQYCQTHIEYPGLPSRRTNTNKWVLLLFHAKSGYTLFLSALRKMSENLSDNLRPSFKDVLTKTRINQSVAIVNGSTTHSPSVALSLAEPESVHY